MKNNIFITVLLLVSSFCTTYGQKLQAGSFEFLKDQTEVNVTFDYSNLKVTKHKISENAYLKKRDEDVRKKNPDEDFYKTWQQQKDENFPNKFFASINKNSKINFSNNPQAKYTLVVESEWLDPGTPGVKMALLSSKLVFIETENPKNVVLVIGMDKAEGKTMAMHRNIMISECYAMTAKKLGEFLEKKI
ncbi:hypothetical protein [Flavobacterium sp. HSC-61S13]|uniref:hypothetical protein n=1 Tax=Flavobacterium sp. HSC-61S13 TaxID=2910963 RepID=UPI00209FFBE8|nr:hypothetical protein [Flavobacterium sp. HSC-61S13]MCP1995553.1 hypothetical protein [Flavobacterium sp. HSC-61S13]